MISLISYTTDKPMHNVIDSLKGLSAAEVKSELSARRSNLINVCMNHTDDFNKSSVIRASNAFLCKEIILVGKKKFDRRGSLGLHHLETVKHVQTLEECVAELHEAGYTVFAVDNTPEINPTAVYDVDLPELSAFVYGEEQAGLSAESVALCDAAIFLPQYGSVRSLNVAQAAAVMMSEYTRRWRR